MDEWKARFKDIDLIDESHKTRKGTKSRGGQIKTVPPCDPPVLRSPLQRGVGGVNKFSGDISHIFGWITWSGLLVGRGSDFFRLKVSRPWKDNRMGKSFTIWEKAWLAMIGPVPRHGTL